MANEGSISTTSRYSKGGVSLPALSVTKAVTITGTPVMDEGKSIGTTEVQIDTTGFTLDGILHIINRDDTNYVEYGGTTGVYSGKLKPGEPNIVRMNNWTGLYIKANTAACIVQVRIFSD